MRDKDVNKGDMVRIHVEAEEPVSVQIMSEDDFDSFDPDDEGNENYWESPRTTDYDYSWKSSYEEGMVIVVIDEVWEDVDEDEDGEAKVMIRIDAVRKVA